MQKTAHHQNRWWAFFINLSRFEKFYFDGGGPFLSDFIWISLMIWERPTTDFGGGPFFALVFLYKLIHIEKLMQKTAHHQIGGGPFESLHGISQYSLSPVTEYRKSHLMPVFCNFRKDLSLIMTCFVFIRGDETKKILVMKVKENYTKTGIKWRLPHSAITNLYYL